MQTGIIYRAFNIISKKSYIGQTIQTLQQRKQQHFQSTIKAAYKFGRALQKYSETNWEWTVLAEVEIDKLDEYEIFFIKDLDTYKNGYNTHPGGNWLGENNPRHDTTIYELWHPEYGIVTYTYRQLIQISKSFCHLPELIKGKRNHIDGYVLPNNKDNYNNILKIHKFYHPDHGTVECTAQHLHDVYGKNFKSKECNVYELTKKRINIYYGWVLEENKNNYKNIIDRSTSITLYNPEHGKVTLKKSEFKEQYGLTDSGISYLINGKNKSSKGWTITNQTFELVENDKFLNKLTTNTFKDYCLDYISNKEGRLYIADRYPLIAEAYDKLGADRMKALSYNKQKLINELKLNRLDIQKCIQQEVIRLFKINNIYTASEIKDTLTNIYNRLMLKKTAKATDLENYFILNKKSKRVNNKVVKVIELVKTKT